MLPVVPAPTNFRGVIEPDGSLTLRWTPSTDADGEPFAIVLFVDGIATQTLAPGETAVNLGPFDPADRRRFAVVAVDADGTGSPLSNELRSTSVLAGRSLDEVKATLLGRGFLVGAVRGSGTVVAEPARPVLATVGGPVDLVLGEPGAPQSRFVFTVVGRSATRRRRGGSSPSGSTRRVLRR